MSGIKIGRYTVGWGVIILIAITILVIYLKTQSGEITIGPFESWKAIGGK